MVGDTVDVYIHPDPNKTVSLAYPMGTITRIFGCEKRFKSMSKFYLLMGLGFVICKMVGIIMLTIAHFG